MKIAIVAPSPIPFTVGGAEKLWWGMLEYINKHTTHQCELIKVPTNENSFWGLIESYQKFYDLDLSHFDMVITGKYPAWMVRHHNHHIFMLHCLRGFYDCYHFLNLNDDKKSKNKKYLKIIEKIENETTSIEEVFELLLNLKNDKSIDENLFQFPSVLIKKIIHFFDKKAMQNIKCFSAISKTVADRKEYFPSYAKVKVLYPPSVLTNFKSCSYDYFFTVSRLDDAKRIAMIIEAYMKSNTSIPLKIAGTGPLSEQFKILTEEDNRIELLGFVSDDDLINYYAHAYAILFVPYDEDYGLITIEAMMSEKPVLTFNDSGGVVEFVEDKVTGLVCSPDIDELTKNIEYISTNPDLCESMGREAKKRVQNITWENVMGSLLNESFNQSQKEEKKKKITVVTTYPIYPPRGGGQNRIFYLYKELAKSMIVDIVCLVHESEKHKKSEIAPNLFEIRVPKTKQHAHKEWEIEKKAGIPVTDIAMMYLYEETPLLRESIESSYRTSQFLIATQPYTYELCKLITKNVIHDSQNVEYNLKKQMLEDNKHNQKLLEMLFETEKKACLESTITTVCALDDAIVFENLYGFDKTKATLVANGVDLNSVPFVSQIQRKDLKKSLGLENQKIVLFIGSWHQPNIDAVGQIFKMALKLPHYTFIVMGSVAQYFSSYEVPKNVGFAGVTTDEEKEMYLSIADIAINPMRTGSGTNLKMLDYMANGVPVISTEVGVRGLGIPNDYIVKCEIDNFVDYMQSFYSYVDIEKSRKYVEETFSWKIISNHLQEVLN
jgi:glycosyltransferase involved in cell wall biosynthesis